MKPAASLIGANRPTLSRVDGAKHVAFLTVLSVFLVWGGRQVMPWDKMFPDLICYWSAGKIFAAGQNPYDVDLQIRVQQEHGWDKGSDGFGLYEFLPYYYPPWFGFLWIAVLPLGFEGAKLAWFFINVELTLLTAALLKSNLHGLPSWAPYTFVIGFLFTLAAIVLGQTSILVLFLTALTWALLSRQWDRGAGFALAWMTIKPQLTALVIVAVLIWLIRRHRYQGVISFLITSAVLAGISSLVLPTWLSDMLNAPRITPSPTEHYPWIGNSWFLVLRALGLAGAAFWISYLVVAAPFTIALLKAAAAKENALSDVLGLAVIGAFFVAPYARHYDFPILLIPILLVMRRRPTLLMSATFVLLFLLIPYGQMVVLAHLKAEYAPAERFLLECSYFWAPVAALVGLVFVIKKDPLTTPSIVSKTAHVA